MEVTLAKFHEQFVAESLSKEYLYKFHINTIPYPVLHRHYDYWEFTLITEGTIIEERNGETKFRKAGEIFSASPGDSHSILLADDKPIRYITIMIELQTFLKLARAISPNILDALIQNECFTASERLISNIERVIHQVHTSDRRNTEKWNDFLCSAVLLILQKQLHLFTTKTDSPATKPWQSNLFTLMARPESPLYKVSDLCRLLSYSRMHLTRLFQEDFNMSPHEYLLDFRLKYAANLLLHTTKTIIDISADVGFTNLSRFNVAFKEQYGVTPKQFRQMS